MREYQLSIVFMLKTDKAYIFHFQNKPNKFSYTYIYLYKYPINFRSLINIEKKPLLFLVLSCFLVFVRSFLSSLSPLSLSLSFQFSIHLSIYLSLSQSNFFCSVPLRSQFVVCVEFRFTFKYMDFPPFDPNPQKFIIQRGWCHMEG